MPGKSWVGKRFGRFKIIQLLGKGAMASVFRAQDIRLKRHVALKVVARPDPDDQKQAYKAQQFIREARSAARLDHPHIVRIYEVDAYKAWLYIAMELVEGGNLHELVEATGPLDVARACVLVAEAAEALDHAHASGVLHRDIKPANLMLSRDGRCKLTDFGLAQLDDPDDGFAMPSHAIGTPSFVAPETTVGQPATAQTEVYSLGATLFFLLVGRPPFDGKTIKELARQHREEPVPRLDEIDPAIPATLADAADKAMAKKPGERFASCKQFAMVLRRHTVAPGISPESTNATAPPAAPEPEQDPIPVAGPAARANRHQDEPAAEPATGADEPDDLESLAAAAGGAGVAAGQDEYSQPAPRARQRTAKPRSKARSKAKPKPTPKPTPRRRSARIKSASRRTPVYIGGAVAAVLLIGLGAVGVYQLTRTAPPPEPASNVLKPAEPDTATDVPADASPPDPGVPAKPGLVGDGVDAAAPDAQPEPAPSPDPVLVDVDPPAPVAAARGGVMPVPTPGAGGAGGGDGAIEVSDDAAIRAAMEQGRHVVVRGRVSAVTPTSTGKGVRVRFEGADEFYVYYETAVGEHLEQDHGGKLGAGLVGQTVQVDGRIRPFFGTPQIKVEESVQVRVVE